MRSKDDFIYDLTCDGNVNRFMTWLCKKFNEEKSQDQVKILLPARSTEKSRKFIEEFCAYINNGSDFEKVQVRWALDFYDNPQDQRQDPKDVLMFWAENGMTEWHADEVIFESNALGPKLLRYKELNKPDLKLTYWCPVLMAHLLKNGNLMKEEYIKMDKKTMPCVDEIIVATNAEMKWIAMNTDVHNQKVKIDNNFISFKDPFFKKMLPTYDDIARINSKYDSRHVIFFPFRLTDKGYHIDEVIEACDELARLYGDFMLLYSNPNNADDALLKSKSYAYKVSTSRETYYSLLQHPSVIVPYLEDIDYIWHASANEVRELNTKVIFKHQKLGGSRYFGGFEIESVVISQSIIEGAKKLWTV